MHHSIRRSFCTIQPAG